tara:strand:- start:687 stop:1775 length:1089 start_codon:yes stop_codon:yes gene_type:complete
MINVLITINCKGPFSVYQAQIEMICSLKNKGVNIKVIGFYSDKIKCFFDEKGIDNSSIYPKTRIDNQYIKDVRNNIKENKIDILHVLDGKSLRNCVLAVKKEKLKLITYFGSASIHWHDLSSYLTYLNPRVDKIICNSTYVFEHVKKQLFRKNKNKVVKIYKGYNPKWFKDIIPFDYNAIGISKESFIVAFAGTNTKNKRISDFIKSSRYLETEKEVHYVIFGKDTDAENLKKCRQESPIKNNIHLLGLRPNAVSLIKGSSLYVQTSLSEGFGRAISEAMSVGKPVIMTDAGGCTELIDENCGIITPVKNPEAIGKAISTLVNNDKLRIKMGNNAQKRIEKVYHINDTVDDTLDLYNRLLKK